MLTSIMSDTTPEIPAPAPELAPSVLVTPAQVWSAAAQNIAIVAAITAAYFMGKCPLELWIAALSYVAGVDLYGRKLASRSGALALAIGATGAFSGLGRLLLVLVAAAGVSLGSGCGHVNETLEKAAPTIGAVLVSAQAAHSDVVEARKAAEEVVARLCAAPPEDLVQVCAKAAQLLVKAHEATNAAADAGNVAKSLYDTLNAELKQ